MLNWKLTVFNKEIIYKPLLKLSLADDKEDSSKKRQKRGGKALMKNKKKEVGEQIVKISRSNRGKKKYVTCMF